MKLKYSSTEKCFIFLVLSGMGCLQTCYNDPDVCPIFVGVEHRHWILHGLLRASLSHLLRYVSCGILHTLRALLLKR